ncbi:MAG: methyltransferase domain-containing protein [Nanoarchaeota archaeon]
MVDFNVNWYERLLSKTNEKEILVSKLRSLLEGKTHETCLEIGLGTSPYFAKNLSKFFKKYVIVEKRKIEVSIPKKVVLINEDWEDCVLTEKFDVIIASHVIYYFKDKKKAFDKIFNSLNDGGRVYFGVNGKESDYGPLKIAFSELIGEEYSFTYDELISLLKGKKYKEYTVPSSINFNSHEDLYETLRIIFDHYPNQYQKLKDKMIDYYSKHLKGNTFIVDQKIIEVAKD